MAAPALVSAGYAAEHPACRASDGACARGPGAVWRRPGPHRVNGPRVVCPVHGFPQGNIRQRACKRAWMARTDPEAQMRALATSMGLRHGGPPCA